MSYLKSDLVLYLLPLPAVLITFAVALFNLFKKSMWDWPGAVAVGIPIPLAATYAWWCWQFTDPLTLLRVFAPQVFVLILLGLWLLVSIARDRELSFISPLFVLLVGLIGHAWTVLALNAAYG